MKQASILMVAVLILLIGVVGYMLMQKTPAPEAPAQEVAEDGTILGDASKDGSAGTPTSGFTVRYTDTGFSPELITVPVGTTVTFINQGSDDMWVGSDEHPTHTQYDGTNKDTHCVEGQPSSSFDQCGVSIMYSFTFDKAGTWAYHNHRNEDHRGKVIVTP